MDQENRKKRTRDEFGVSSSDSPEVKLARVDSEANSPLLEPDRDELVEVREDLLSIFDDSDEPVVQGLESVIKSFEEEIHVGVPVPDMLSDSGGSQTDLGYLLEASDDELGLPPTFAVGEEKDAAAVAVLPAEEEGPGTVGFVEMLGFQDEIPSYDSFEFGLVGNTEGNHNYCDNNGWMPGH